MEEIINKVLFMLFILSIFNVIKNVFYVIPYIKAGVKYPFKDREIFLLGLSMAYIITCILNGINI